ncbi:PXA domain-containing protein [Gongronella butleri]|nr:PXA domain-containing protein [Gongronella butleri]
MLFSVPFILASVVLAYYLWPSFFHLSLYAVQLTVSSLFGLLLLNLVVLYIYVKYVISPFRRSQRSTSSTLLFPPLIIGRSSARWRRQVEAEQQASEPKATGAVAAAFDQLVRYVLRDFIHSWYTNVAGTAQQPPQAPQAHEASTSTTAATFPMAIDDLIHTAAQRLTQRLQQTDRTALALNRLLPRITAHVADFRAAETALRGRFLERVVTQSDEMDLLVASHYHGGKLHPALTTAAASTKPTEVDYLRHLVDRLLPKLLPAHHLACAPVRILVREMAVGALMQPVMQMLADPDFWNQTLDTQLSKALREQQMVQQLRQVLDRHSTDVDGIPPSLLSPSERLSTAPTTLGQLSRNFLGLHEDDDTAWHDQDFDPDKARRNASASRLGRRTFQAFLRMIEDEPNILDLKRLRNDMVTQIRKKRALVSDRDPEEVIDGEKVEDLNVYIHRLGVAKKKVDKRIALLSGEQSDFTLSAVKFFGVRKSRPALASSSGFTLMDILTNTAGLSYFMEFMDRREALLKLQFWLMVEGFKSAEDAKQDMFVQDAHMVYDMYFADGAVHKLGNIPDQLVRDLQSALHQASASATEQDDDGILLKAELQHRLNILQQHVFWQMDKEEFPYFKRSDLYFKFLASTPTPEPTSSTGRRSLDERSLTSSAPTSPVLDHPRQTHQPRPRDTSASASRAPLSTDKKQKPVSASAAGTKHKLPQPLVVERTRSERLGSKRSPRSPSNHSFFGSFSVDSLEPSRHQQTSLDQNHSNNGKAGATAAATAVTAAPTWSSTSPASSISTLPKLDLEDEDDVDDLHDDDIMDDTDENIDQHTVDAVEAELQSILDGGDVVPTASRDVDASSLQNQQNQQNKQKQQEKRPSVAQLSPSDASDASSSSHMPTSSPDRATDDDDTAVAPAQDNIHYAPPGDLMLASEVKRLAMEIDKLMQQEAIVDALIKKAEVRDKQEELRILVKSKSMFRREREQIEYQRHQYEEQQTENVLSPNRTRVSITNATIGSDVHGEFALYVIELQQVDGEGNQTSGWIVARRYSEFFDLHQQLKAHYASVRSIAFPTKWPLLKLQKSFVEARRINLERYLRQLLTKPDLCQSDALKLFLSQQQMPPSMHSDDEMADAAAVAANAAVKHPLRPQKRHTSSPPSSTSSTSLLAAGGDQGFMRHIYNTVAAGIDDLLMGPSMLDLITQRLGEQVTANLDSPTADYANPPPSSTSAASSPAASLAPSSTNAAAMAAAAAAAAVAASAAATGTSSSVATPIIEPEGLTRFSEPLCDLFIEAFELKEKNNWLRRQAVVILLQQIFGGTIERKIRDTFKDWESERMLLFYFERITGALWPDGAKWQPRPARKPEDKLHTKDEANRKLSTWLPEMLGGMVGRQNARRGARRLFSVLQNQRLNQHLAYVILDEVVAALFPDVDFSA